MSVMLSMPNFSRNASASTIAVIDSPITAAAGTAHESARSLKARVGFPVARSTVRRALAIVEIGFIAAERVAGVAGCVDLGLHPFRDIGVGAADLRLVGLGRLQGGALLGVGGRPDSVDRACYLDPEPGEELLGNPAGRHPRGSLAGAGSFQDVAQVVEIVLLHPGEIGVTGTGQRDPIRRILDRVRGHTMFPVGVVVVADEHGDGRAQGVPVAHPAQKLDLVPLYLLAPAAAVTLLPAG